MSEIDLGVVLCIFGQDKVTWGELMFTDCNGTFNSIMDRKEDKYVLGGLIYEL